MENVKVKRQHNIHDFGSLMSVLPGRGAESRDEGLQQTRDEDEGVFPGDDEVQRRQNDHAMYHEADYHCYRIHAELTAHLSDVIHLHDFSSNQKEDTNRCIPGNRIWSLKTRCTHLPSFILSHKSKLPNYNGGKKTDYGSGMDLHPEASLVNKVS